MLRSEDIVQMAKDAERYRFIRENCGIYSKTPPKTPAEFERLVDSVMDKAKQQ